MNATPTASPPCYSSSSAFMVRFTAVDLGTFFPGLGFCRKMISNNFSISHT